jgi:hypothetical protein
MAGLAPAISFCSRPSLHPGVGGIFIKLKSTARGSPSWRDGEKQNAANVKPFTFDRRERP